MSSKSQDLAVKDTQNKTRLLLALWDMQESEAGVKKGELTKRVQRKTEKAKDYQSTFEQLQEEGAIAFTTNNRFPLVSLTDKGKHSLGEALKKPEFNFDGNQVGARVANALLKWIRQMDVGVSAPATATNGNGKVIASYEEFQQTALGVYDRLNRDFNLDNLVPIYRIRREIGERVTRSQFNEWLLDMQANDIVQLIGGEMTDITTDKAEDSIKTELGALRFYAKRLS